MGSPPPLPPPITNLIKKRISHKCNYKGILCVPTKANKGHGLLSYKNREENAISQFCMFFRRSASYLREGFRYRYKVLCPKYERACLRMHIWKRKWLSQCLPASVFPSYMTWATYTRNIPHPHNCHFCPGGLL